MVLYRSRFNYSVDAQPLDFPSADAEQFKAAAVEGEKNLKLISDMVLTFANAQNGSYQTFKDYKFGETLNPVFDGRSPVSMTNREFNAMFKEELIKVLTLLKSFSSL